MKKRVLIFPILLLIIFLCACGNRVSDYNFFEDKSIKTLNDHGLEVISLLSEMVKSDTYGKLLNDSSEIQNIAASIREGNYTEPSSIYKISVPDNAVSEMYSAMDLKLNELSENLTDNLNKKLLLGIANLINAKEGTASLAAGSIYAANKVFVSNEINEDLLYIYTFESGYPIIITFLIGDDGAVNATGNFLLNTELNTNIEENLKKILGKENVLSRSVIEKIK